MNQTEDLPVCWEGHDSSPEDSAGKLRWHAGAPFATRQSYETRPARQVECGQCGSTAFDVALGSYLTVIRCQRCLTELIVHDG